MYGRADGLYIIMRTLRLYKQHITAAPERFIIIIIVVVHVYVCKTCDRLFETVWNISLYYIAAISSPRVVWTGWQDSGQYIGHIYNHDQDAYEKSVLRTEFCSASIKNKCTYIFFIGVDNYTFIPNSKKKLHQKVESIGQTGGAKIQ